MTFDPRKLPTIAGQGGKKASGGQQAQNQSVVEAPDTLKSKQYARVMDLLGEGPIDDVVGIYLDGVRLFNANGTVNFKGVTYTWRRGVREQLPIPGFGSQMAESVVGVKFQHGQPIVRTIVDGNVDRVRVTLSVPSLFDGVSVKNNIKGTKVQFRIYIQTNGGGFKLLDNCEINGKTMTRYQKAFVFALPVGGPPWDIRIDRLTSDSTQDDLQNELWWDSMTAIIDAKMMYSYSAISVLKVDAEQFSAIPKRTWDVRGLILRVPSNYDPETRRYTGTWDGSFKSAWSNNPAWVFWDIVTDDRYGLGDMIEIKDVDRWTLYEIGQWCDQLVPNGKGGREPRFQCNAIISTQREAIDVLQDLASVFRGFVYYTGGLLTCAADMPADPVALFTNANVVDGIFSYQGSDIRARHTVATVTWNDPSNLGEPRLQWVEDPDAVSRYGIQKLDIAAFGCTSQAQAIRAGRWALYTEQQETEIVTFSTGLEGAYVKPGDVIKVIDQMVGGERQGGRIRSSVTVPAGTASEVTLDAPVLIRAPAQASPYLITAMTEAGTPQTRQIGQWDPARETDVVYAYPAFSPPAVPDSPFVITQPTLEERFFRIITIAENAGERTYSITALEHNKGKWDWVEKNIPIDEPDVSNIQVIPPAVRNLTVREYLKALSPISVGVGAVLSWTSDAPSFDVQYREQNGNWTIVRTQAQSIDIDVTETWWEFYVTPISLLGRRGPASYLLKEIIGRRAPPATPTGFSVTVIGGLAHFTWDRSTEIDVLIGGSYEIQYTPRLSGAGWDSALPLISGIAGTATSAEAPYKAGTYFLRARDILGIESLGWATISSQFESDLYRPYVRLCESPDWPGEKNNTAVVEPQNWLIIGDDEGTWDQQTDPIDNWLAPAIDRLSGSPVTSQQGFGAYEFENILDLGGVFSTRLSIDMLVSGYYTSEPWVDDRAGNTDDWDNWDGGLGTTTGNVRVFISITDDDPDAPDAEWRPWREFLVGEFTGRAFKFRLEMTAPIGQNIQIEELCVLADIRNKVDQGEDIQYSGVRKHINFNVKFFTIPAVGVTLQDAKSGDHILISNKTRTGFDLDVFTTSGGQVANIVFDWIAAGY